MRGVQAAGELETGVKLTTWVRRLHIAIFYDKLVLRLLFQGFHLWKLELRSF